MKLKKFTKNKKQKQILIGSIIGILVLIGGISLYRSFAMYKEEKTFDVLQGTVPDFRKTKTYTEELLNGADPVLDEKGELVPVKIGDNGIVTKADVAQEWYSYEKKEWANAVILTEAGKQQSFADNSIIDENYIESYFVWIPKYRYKLWDLGLYTNLSNIDTSKVHPIEIEFGLTDTVDDEGTEEYKQCKTPMNDEGTQGLSGQSGECNEGDWMTHPAFISFGANGFWVGKFETGYKDATSTTDAQNHNTTDKSKVVIKPNQYSWRNITVANAYQNSYQYKRDLDSHMMKNTEWGAVAYLTQSIYGRCTSNACTEVTINSQSGYLTGYTNSNVPYFSNSTGASTTNNYSGIYDMSGGAWEYMASVMNNSSDIAIDFGSSGLNAGALKGTKYYDVYKYTGDMTHWNRRILGDATGELGPFQSKDSHYVSSYFDDWGLFVISVWPWFIRGGNYNEGTHTGVFAFSRGGGEAKLYSSFRIVLTPQ